MDRFTFFLQRNYRQVAAIAVAVVIFGVLFNFVSNFGFYELTINQDGSAPLNIELVDQNTRESTTSSASEKTVRKFVRKNNYEAIVSNNELNGYASFESGGFFRTTKVAITLQKEKYPEFVGDNPSTCMDFLSGSLYSYMCRTTSTVAINKHIGATKQTPGYVTKAGEVHLGSINATISTDSGLLAIVAPPKGTDLYTGRYSVYSVGKNFSLYAGAEIKVGPAISNTVRFFPYKSGILIAEGSKAWYYEHLGKNEVVEIDDPVDEKLKIVSLTVESNTPVYTYNDVGIAVSDSHEFSPEKTEFVILGEDGSKHFSVDKGYSHAMVCGENLLCAWNDRLDVYEINGSELDYARTLTGSMSTASVKGDKVIVTNSTGILEVDPRSGTGFYPYTLGAYKPCGHKHHAKYSLLCVIDGNNNKKALFIDWTKEASSAQEDKRIYELTKTPDIKGVSVYKKIVHVVPEFGATVQQEDGRFGYNSTTKALAIENVKTAITRSGLENSGYTVVTAGF